MASKTVQDVILELKRIQCCNVCILRFINEKNVIDYSESSVVIGKLLGESLEEEDSPLVKSTKSNPCSVCLGLLQEPHCETHIEKIVQDANAAAYDADEVTFALSLPISLLLRNFSTWLHISQLFSSYYLDKQIYNDMNACYDELKLDGNVVSLKEAWKILVAPKIAKQLGKTLNNGVDSCFFANVHFDYADDSDEIACLADMHPDIFGNRENQRRKYHNEVFTRKSVEMALDKTDKDLFEAHSPVPPVVPTSFASCRAVLCSHDSLYIAGRYNKFSRSLSQTPWLINGERRMESSVEELINAPVGRRIPHDVIKFSSSGREDVDVRTLGTGRPFVLDVQNPRITKLSFADLRDLETEMNTSTKSVFVRDLQIVPKKDLVHIKTGERMKTKTYHCLCVMKGSPDPKEQQQLEETLRKKLEGLSCTEPFVIQQKTPMRVLHRRPQAVRPRTIHWIKGQFSEIEGENILFQLQVKVEAGTYIKELVHGDLGRTVPSISEMFGLDVDILALDVEEINLLWPPSVTHVKAS